MGKLGKKKRGSSSKSQKESHKAKIQSRKGKALAPAIAEADGHITRFTLVPGDRVWFFHNGTNVRNEPNTYRGILRSLGDCDCRGRRFCKVQPFANFFKGNPSTIRVRDNFVFRDLDAWTTRFKPGDRVFYKTASNGGWLSGEIMNVWPIWKENRDNVGAHMPCYEVRSSPTTPTPDNSPVPVTVYLDNDSWIQERNWAYSFRVGDKVVFNSKKAISLSKRGPTEKECWIPGVVEKANRGFGLGSGSEFDYAQYTCTSETKDTYYILKDDEEHIATADTPPIVRFSQSIEQGCSYAHLEYMVEEFHLDLSHYKKILLKLALGYGNFDALRWLEEKLKVDQSSRRILDQMAASRHAECFFSSLNAYISESDMPLDQWQWGDLGFLQILVDSGNLRAMEVVFSLKNDLFWTIALHVQPSFPQLSPNHKNSVVALVLNEFLEHAMLYSQICELNNIQRGTTEQEVLAKANMRSLMEENTAIKFLRFARMWEVTFNEGVLSIVTSLAENGFFELFALFFGIDETIASMGSNEPYFDPGITHNEFFQPELANELKWNDNEEVATIIPIVVRGRLLSRMPFFRESADGEKMRSYLNQLKEFALGATSTDFDSIVEFLERKRREEEEKDDVLKNIYRYQLDLLQDDNTVCGRKRILDFLVNQELWAPPNILDPIRMRQGGIFQWAIKNSSKKLDSCAILERDLYSPMANNLELMVDQLVLKECSLGTFLAFACVELDSFQILAWLVEKEGVAISSLVGGFNLLHACAYFGRMETIVWLRSRPEWGQLLKEFATRQGFEQMTAAHIAVQKGHTVIAEVLLELGCSPVDGSMETIEMTAAVSLLKHVQDWGGIDRLFRWKNEDHAAAAATCQDLSAVFKKDDIV